MNLFVIFVLSPILFDFCLFYLSLLIFRDLKFNFPTQS